MSSPNDPSIPDKMGIKRLPLPRVPGPKLEPFQGTATADIEFIAFIGNDEDMDSKVWKVRIKGRVYVLKVVSTAQMANHPKFGYTTLPSLSPAWGIIPNEQF